MPETLTLASRTENGCLILEASGEFTRHHRGRFVNTVRQQVKPGIRKVVVDVGGLELMTPSALAELAEIHCMLAEAGCRLVLACPPPQVRKMLVLSFLDKIIATAPTVGDALAAT